MANAAIHRGPEGVRYWLGGDAGLVHLALHVTPESVCERQPLPSQDGRLVLTADARIDNREELTHLLRAKRYLFEEAPTDAALILAAYRCWGEACPAHLIGDFAFVIWDQANRRLFAARDPMGMRALYYRHEPSRILFATEVAQILAAPGVPVKLFEPAVAAHLVNVFDHLEWTFYEGVSQLPPGHVLSVGPSGLYTRRYWDFDPELRIEYPDDAQYAEHFLDIFKEAVGARLRSVKPAGILLSGGLDSGSVAATAGWLRRNGRHDTELHAYCWAYRELTQCDERHISSGIVSEYGFPINDVTAEDAHPLKDYPAHGPHRDEPFIGHYQPLIERALARAQTQGMGPIFFGARGDLTMGVDIFDYLGLLRSLRWATLWRDLQAHRRHTGTPLRKLIKQQLRQPLKASLLSWLSQRELGALRHLWPQAPERQRQYRPPDWMPAEFAERLGLPQSVQRPLHVPARTDFARRERYRSVFSPLNMRIMTWLERTIARFGMTLADPFSDRRIASFCLAVPQHVLNRPGEEKRLTRLAMRGIMPEEVRQASRKILPGPLLDRALHDWAHPTVVELLTSPRVAAGGYADEKALHRYYEAYRAGERNDPRFWYILTLEMWLRQHWG